MPIDAKISGEFETLNPELKKEKSPSHQRQNGSQTGTSTGSDYDHRDLSPDEIEYFRAQSEISSGPEDPLEEDDSIETFHTLLHQRVEPFVIQCAKCRRKTFAEELTDPAQLFLPITCRDVGEVCGSRDSVPEDVTPTKPAFAAGSYVCVKIDGGTLAPAMIDYVPQMHPQIVCKSRVDSVSQPVEGYYVSFLSTFTEVFSSDWFPKHRIIPMEPAHGGLMQTDESFEKFQKCRRSDHIYDRLYRYSYMAHKYRLHPPYSMQSKF